MGAIEGVIKYRLDFARGMALDTDLLKLNTWRSILYGLDLIGQDPARYLGYGYGNISQRDSSNPEHFIISASQTGGLERLENTHYTLIEQCDPAANSVLARGPLPPSSEALTHAMIYRMRPAAACVMHVHDPVLWRYGLEHGLPRTAESTEYGSIEMAREVEELFDSPGLAEIGLLFMAGHEDGLLSFGDSIDQAGSRMVQLWVEARHH